MNLALLSEWRDAVAALLVSLACAGLARAFGRPALATGAAGLGVAAGWVLALGVVVASPRQLPERLPLLAAVAAGGGLALAAMGFRRWTWAAAMLGALVGAWWLGGAPLVAADVARAGIPLLGLALLATLTLFALDGPVPAVLAAAALCGGLLLAAPFGPWLLLGVAVLAATLGGMAGGLAWPPGARLGPALAVTALAAGPVLARGAPADWLVAATVPAALWLAPGLAARFGGGRFGAVLGGGIAVAIPLALLILATRR